MNPSPPSPHLDQRSANELQNEVLTLRQQLASTRERMEELENTVEAIRGGNVDAVVVDRDGSTQVWTLAAADKLHLDLSKQTANIGTWDWDIATGAVHWSDSLLHSFGITSAGPPRFDALLELVHADDRERVQRNIAAALEHDDEFYEEFRVIRCDAETRWIAARGRVVRSFRRKPQRLVGISFDITERRQAEEELRQADRAKDEFLAMLAHELRNPLAAISNAIRLNREPDLPADERQWIGQMLQRQTDQLGHLIDDLLDVARITRSKIELRKENVSLTDVANRTLDTLRPQLQRSRQRLTLDFPSQPVWANADASRLEQVLVNLITNAIKYTKEEGQIWIKIVREENDAVIAVKDTGIGIAPEMLPRVFELFAQAEQGLDRSRGGLGIGLTLVRRIVDLHGGSVHVASPGVGMGSEFTVRLPAVEPPAEAALARPAHSPATSSLRILVVDDNRDAAQSLSMLLKASGHETAIAYSGQRALELAANFHPQVALLDIGLPGMNGLELGEQLRQSHPGIFLVAVSGYGQADDRARTKAAGFDEHFVKPVRLDDLLRALVGRVGAR
jgi:PAS domain S-box-containing protein